MKIYLQAPVSRNPWHWVQILANLFGVHWAVAWVPYQAHNIILHFTETLGNNTMGTYDSDTKQIDIAREPSMGINHVTLHELGHHVWFHELTDDQRKQWERWVSSNCRAPSIQEIKRVAKQGHVYDLAGLQSYLNPRDPILWAEVSHILNKQFDANNVRNCTLDELYKIMRKHKGIRLFRYAFTSQCVPAWDNKNYNIPWEVFAEAFAAHYGKRKMPPQVKKQLLPLLSTSSKV